MIWTDEDNRNMVKFIIKGEGNNKNHTGYKGTQCASVAKDISGSEKKISSKLNGKSMFKSHLQFLSLYLSSYH